MDQRFEFVLAHRGGTPSIAALRRLFGISLQTRHKWFERFSPRVGEASLQELPRRPLHSACDTAGAGRTHVSRRTAILEREGLVRARARRQRLPPRTQPFSRCTMPNQVWCVDFQGQFRTGDTMGKARSGIRRRSSYKSLKRLSPRPVTHR